MSSRLATRLGLPAPEDRLPGARDLVRFHEPATGSLVRTKGSLFLLAQLTGGDAHLARAAGEALEQLQHDYYYDLSAGSLGALGKALANANRRLYHQRGRLGIPRRAGVSRPMGPAMRIAMMVMTTDPRNTVAISNMPRRGNQPIVNSCESSILVRKSIASNTSASTMNTLMPMETSAAAVRARDTSRSVR